MTNVVFPMAGAGSRFASDGYDTPKPLLDVDGMYMIQRAAYGCNMGGRHIYIVQKEHSEKYNLKELLPSFTPPLEVVVIEVDGVTEGAAASVLLAKEYIDNDDLLVICDSDTIMDWDPIKFLVDGGEGRHLDGALVTFPAEGDSWSYVELGPDEEVKSVSEKTEVSTHGCAGVYYWRRGSDFVKCAEDMIKKDLRVNNEFYVAPVYNQAIQKSLRVGIHEVETSSVISLGTPELYEEYLAAKKSQGEPTSEPEL